MGVVLLYEDACEEVYALVWGCASRALFLVFLGVSEHVSESHCKNRGGR